MVTWTAPQLDTIDAPTFSLSGLFLTWPDGTPAVLKQTVFSWQIDAWQACIEISSPAGESRYAYGMLRLPPSVVAAWERRHLNPRREAAEQLRRVIRPGIEGSNLGTLTLRAV